MVMSGGIHLENGKAREEWCVALSLVARHKVHIRHVTTKSVSTIAVKVYKRKKKKNNILATLDTKTSLSINEIYLNKMIFMAMNCKPFW